MLKKIKKLNINTLNKDYNVCSVHKCSKESIIKISLKEHGCDFYLCEKHWDKYCEEKDGEGG